MLLDGIETVTPTSSAIMDDYYGDFKYFWHFIEVDRPSEEDFKQALYEIVPGATLVYYAGLPLCAFMIAEASDSVELHGMLRPDYKSLLPKPEAMLFEIQTQLLAYCFYKLGKKKVVFKAHPDNKGVRGFAIKWRARRLKNKDRGRTVYVIDRAQFLEQVRPSEE